jgi:hypothetical protein
MYTRLQPHEQHTNTLLTIHLTVSSFTARRSVLLTIQVGRDRKNPAISSGRLPSHDVKGTRISALRTLPSSDLKLFRVTGISCTSSYTIRRAHI